MNAAGQAFGHSFVIGFEEKNLGVELLHALEVKVHLFLAVFVLVEEGDFAVFAPEDFVFAVLDVVVEFVDFFVEDVDELIFLPQLLLDVVDVLLELLVLHFEFLHVGNQSAHLGFHVKIL